MALFKARRRSGRRPGLGIGYAKKGILRCRVCFPLRDKDGKLVAYCGYAAGGEPALKLPPKFHL